MNFLKFQIFFKKITSHFQLINKRKAILAQSEEEIEADGKTRPFIDSIIKTKSNKDITAHILTIFGAVRKKILYFQLLKNRPLQRMYVTNG